MTQDRLGGISISPLRAGSVSQQTANPEGLFMDKLGERFWSKVRKTDKCWYWTACKNIGGYGRVKIGDRFLMAHRVAYEGSVGQIPNGLQLDHLCRTRECVRPDHLEPVTNKENVLRGNGITAINARKTKCFRGHGFVKKCGGGRECPQCKKNLYLKRTRCATRAQRKRRADQERKRYWEKRNELRRTAV